MSPANKVSPTPLSPAFYVKKGNIMLFFGVENVLPVFISILNKIMISVGIIGLVILCKNIFDVPK